MSNLFQTTSGIYKRLINYFPYMFTYDAMIIPSVNPSLLDSKEKIKECFEQSALRLDKLKLKTNLPVFAKQLFDEGEGYYYKIEDSTGIVYKKIPNKYCLPYKNENNVIRFVLDMNRFNASSEDISAYPIELQRACELFLDKDFKSLFIDGRYYEVSKNGVCFTLANDGKHGIPPFASLFEDLVNLDENKDLQNQVDKLENTKMIHNKIPLNKEGEPIVDPELARKYNMAIKKNLDEGIFSIVNPFESQTLTLNNNSQRTITLVSQAVQQIFTDSGTSDMLFNNQKASSEALKKSIIVDAMMALNMIIPMFDNYITYELKSIKGSIKYKCRVLDTTHFDKDEKHKTAKDDLSIGGSRTYFFATGGFSPLEMINTLKSEQMLDIDSLMVIKQDSHTISSKDTGRPTNEEVGNPTSEITEQVEDLGN